MSVETGRIAATAETSGLIVDRACVLKSFYVTNPFDNSTVELRDGSAQGEVKLPAIPCSKLLELHMNIKFKDGCYAVMKDRPNILIIYD